MRDRKLKRKEVRERLNITRYAYEKLIADGLLDAPVRIGKSHPFHLESQVERCEERLYRKGLPEVRAAAQNVNWKNVERMRARLEAAGSL